MDIKQAEFIFEHQLDSIHINKPERSQKTNVSPYIKPRIYLGSRVTHSTGAGSFGRTANGVGLISMVVMLWIAPAHADGTPECNTGTGGIVSTECGSSAAATDFKSTALGNSAMAINDFSTAVGYFSTASGISSTALGSTSEATQFHSTALGATSKASGSGSTALGSTSTASGSASTALGVGSEASGISSTAMGVGSGASGFSSTALGRDSTASGVDSTALGRTSRAIASSSTALGRNSFAGGDGSTAVGRGTSATENNSTALGATSRASGSSSTALGYFSTASGNNSTAVGRGSIASVSSSTVLGVFSKAESIGATSLGYGAGLIVAGPKVFNSPKSIAIGYFSNIINNSEGAIAIGSDSDDGDSIGAEANGAAAIAIGYEAKATQPGAIAIGADVVADIANTMVVGVPIHIKRDDGSSKLLVNETNATVAVRTLGELENNGGVRFRFNNTALGEEWDFTSNQTGGFQFSLVGSGGAELSVATNGTVRMGPGPISNLTLFPSGNMTIEGVLTENSDRNSKQQITELDHESILDKVSALSIHEWEYKDSPDQRHIGPMAQDFHQAFNLGDDNTHIATLDMAGVALAAIQALQKENKLIRQENQQIKVEKDEQITRLEEQLRMLESKLSLLID